MAYNRYSQFISDGNMSIVPFAEIYKESSDMTEIYKKGITRLDKVSYEYYGESDYAWLILQANPEYGSMEYNIPDGVELRIPYPLNSALSRYNKSINEYKKKYK
jgi:hypothetical protein